MHGKTLTFGYSEPEDRLMLLHESPSGEETALLLTRRLTVRLVNSLAGILEKSSLAASHAPAEMRDDVVLLEHQGAISAVAAAHGEGGSFGARSQETQQSAKMRFVLLTAVSVTSKPKHFEIALKSGGKTIFGFSVNRAELHRILNMLTAKAQGAGWNIEVEAGWLEPGQTMVAMN